MPLYFFEEVLSMEIKMSLIPGGKKGQAGKLNVKTGDRVKTDDILVQVETTKGNRAVRSPEAGVITKVFCEEGSEVSSGQVLFELDTASLKEQPAGHGEDKKSTAQEINTDLLIIGSGPGGYVAAIYAAKKGLKVTIAEKEKLGGTCLNVGCIPTKSLIKSSEILADMKRASSFGISAGGQPTVDMPRIIRRKDEVKENLVNGIASLLENNGITVLNGKASFLSKSRVEVQGKKSYIISAKDIIIATGSKISKIGIPGIELPVVMNSTQALSSEYLPPAITIVGGGVIGMEFAFMYNNLGVKVHVVEFLDRLLSMLDSEISQSIREYATKAGISIHTGSKVMKIQQSEDDKAVVTYEDDKGEHILVSDKVLVAIGREPNLDGLDIEKVGIALNKKGKGVAVDGHMRTNVEHIYAIGDVTNIIQLAHVASYQGMVAVDNILGKTAYADYTAIPNVVFTSPEISGVGLTEGECKEKEIDYSISTASYAANGKAQTMDEPEGFVKLVRDNSTHHIVGGFIMGADASSLISTLTIAVSKGLTDEELAKTVFAHPTTVEVIHEAALGFSVGTIHEI